ncbi:MAG TPA: serine--tRNA ligase [Kofleriaceae bacterium]|nr:serine--tRNA ligase [Kofleriaceae bacterium]
MLDIARLDEVLRRGGSEVASLVDRMRDVDGRRRAVQQGLDQQRSERNSANQHMAGLDKKSPEFGAARDQLRELSQRIKTGEAELGQLEAEAERILMLIPNAPHASVPVGGGEADNQVVSTWGERPGFDFAPRPHWEVGEALGILDFEAAARMSGARFCVLRGAGARLSRALLSFMIDCHIERGYTEVWPPTLLRRHALEGTGQLPKFEDDAFKTAGESEYFLAPTAEVPLVNLHREQILDPGSLPIRYTAYTACFRAEAGSYGKDTRGLIRMHQFDKIELVQLTEPEASYDALESLRRDAEEILQRLGLHYRVSALCTGDLGFGASKSYDLEVWLPGQDAYREISSCSNCEDFQARRARIRYRPAAGEKPRLVHTLNGSGLAIGRTIVAILEQCQQADGAVAIPPALRPYMGGLERISAPA